MILRCVIPLTLVLVTIFSQAQEKTSSEVLEKLREAQRLQQENHYSEALQKLDELEAAHPDIPDIYNLRGSIFMTPALRDFAEAEKNFAKAEQLRPEAIEPRFNKGELLFVKHEWAQAEAAFQKLLDDYPKLPLQIRHLTLYKRLVCEVKLGKFEAAEKTLKDHFTFMDDTPAYYFSHAAIAFGKTHEGEAKDWLARAEAIFKPAELTAYLDTLMEVRWVPNISLPFSEQ
ncbi:Protein of unknown function [Prosthecobacter debontii]|uniref:Uncharacterized protein n=1 Tax=Prosthecobacter debontii TaxID=48467 RepID=A0A1T4YNQ0_9BACT|nr:tetratricopeptide repeat protein [Prosthecobacter debontii]SKB02895.1 Protein of unknown function [Prosthecobacter debontii]